MSIVRIAPLVEGDGEVEAVPALARRIIAHIDPGVTSEVRRGFRHPSGSLRRAGGLERAINAVAVISPDHHVLVLIDSDDDCPKELGQELATRARTARPDLRVSVVLAHREFEAWFLAGAESLAGKRNLPEDLKPPVAPEGIRGAKEWLSERMQGTRIYRPTQDQAALTSLLDINLARERSRSFRKLWSELEGIVQDAVR